MVKFHFGLGKKDDGSQANATVTVEEKQDGTQSSGGVAVATATDDTQTQDQTSAIDGIQLAETPVIIEEPTIVQEEAPSDNPFVTPPAIAEEEIKIEAVQEPVIETAEETTPVVAEEESNPFAALEEVTPEQKTTTNTNEEPMTDPQTTQDDNNPFAVNNSAFDDTASVNTSNPVVAKATTTEPIAQEEVNPFANNVAMETNDVSSDTTTANPFEVVAAEPEQPITEVISNEQVIENETAPSVTVVEENPFATPPADTTTEVNPVEEDVKDEVVETDEAPSDNPFAGVPEATEVVAPEPFAKTEEPAPEVEAVETTSNDPFGNTTFGDDNTTTQDDTETAFDNIVTPVVVSAKDPLSTLSSIKSEITSYVEAHQGKVTDLQQQKKDAKKAYDVQIKDINAQIKEEEALLKDKQDEFKGLIKDMQKLTGEFDVNSEKEEKSAKHKAHNTKKNKNMKKKKVTEKEKGTQEQKKAA